MLKELSYRSWKDFEMEERRRVATFQMSVDSLARDLYLELGPIENKEDDESEAELNFDL